MRLLLLPFLSKIPFTHTASKSSIAFIITIPRITGKISTSRSSPQIHFRAFHDTARSMAMKPKPEPVVVFSAGYDPVQGQTELASILRGTEEGGKWSLIGSGMGVERSFRFKSFKKTWEFMNAIAAECAVKKHHPEWSNVYNTTFIRWTTHSPPGLSEKDILMARFCDEQAVVFGEVVPEVVPEVVDGGETEEGGLGKEGKGGGDVGKELADRVAREGGECCVPRGLRKGTEGAA